MHALLTSLLASLIGLLVFLTAALDHPYRGTESIPATAYQLVLSGLMLDAGTPR